MCEGEITHQRCIKIRRRFSVIAGRIFEGQSEREGISF